MRSIVGRAKILGFFAGFVCTGVFGQAAEPQKPPPEGESAEQIPSQFNEEIVVTARRVDEKLQDVPLSVSVYTASDLAALKISRFDDLGGRVPNLQFYDFNIGLPHFFMRGIGSVNRSGASDPAVAMFVDDVYIGRGFGPSSDFFDMERIEVLRGPQGTFFGRNAVGGAIALHTREPTDRFDASVALTAGNRGRVDVEAIANVPLTDRVFGRVAVLRKTYEGNAFNTETGHHLEDEDRLAVRVSVKVIPMNTLTVLLSTDRTRDEGRGNWWHLGAEGPYSIGKSNPDPRSGRNPVDGMKDRDDWGSRARAEWVTPLGSLTSVTGYRHHQYQALDNTTGLFVAELSDPDRFQFHHTLFIQGQQQTSRALTQELRWSSQYRRDLSWLVGLYYLHEDIDRVPTTRYRFIAFNREGEFGHEARAQVRSYAAFGQAEYRLPSGVGIAAGVRFTSDSKHHRSTTFGEHFVGFRDNGKLVSGWSVQTSGTWSEVTPMVSLRYETNRNLSLYGTVSKGFKSGGFNDEGAEKALVAIPFGPETAWNYEAGVKYGSAAGRGGVRASVFYVNYRDLQVEQFIQPDPLLPPVEITANTGHTAIKGAEVDWERRLGDGFWIHGSYAHLDTNIRDIVLNGVDVSGNQLPYAPKNKIYTGALYARRAVSGSTASLRAGLSYESDFFADIGNSDVTVLGSRMLVDAGFTWSPAESHYGVALWGKNLTDQLYAVTATEVPVRDRYEKFGQPRQYGVTVTYRF